jgi:hypothetical protein
MRSESEIRADLERLAAERARLDEAATDAEARQAEARAKLEQLDRNEARVFVGAIDLDEHRAARAAAERLLDDATRDLASARAAEPGFEEIREERSEELRVCRLAAARERLAEKLGEQQEASALFGSKARETIAAQDALESARADVRALKVEIVELGGAEIDDADIREPNLLVLGPADVADEPGWEIPTAAHKVDERNAMAPSAQVAHALYRVLAGGPERPTAALEEKRRARAAEEESRRLAEWNHMRQAVDFGWPLSTVAERLRPEAEALIAERNEAVRRQQEELRAADPSLAALRA